MNNPQVAAKREYFFIKTLEITILTLIVALLIYFFAQFFQSGTLQITIILRNTSVVYISIICCILALIGGITWRSYRIPPSIQRTIVSYYRNLGYTVKRQFVHTLKVIGSSNIYFKIKILLFKRVSGESCLFRLESMGLPTGSQEVRFKKIGAQYLLKPDLKKKKYFTQSELEEVHIRSLLLIRAVEEFLKTTPN